jgi:tRNA nucleotidyltransferase/poly(A) polymerase
MDMNQLRKKIHKDLILSKLSGLSKEKRIPLFLVGGYLRDLLLEIPGKDYDFALPKDAASFIETIEEVLLLHFFKVGKEEMNTTTYRIIKEETSPSMPLPSPSKMKPFIGWKKAWRISKKS